MKRLKPITETDALIRLSVLEGYEDEAPFKRGRSFKAQFALDGGHCPCDIHGANTCSNCEERIKATREFLRGRVCGCGRQKVRRTDLACPRCLVV